ncbi:histidine--tRNA ligase [Desulforhopalus sp. IMCC35007]|uniref:histidine--tRNA ligase n=1 Tax=Desulforhopalus sp. IMCC35007 TaxID=2569543 RepID=UPI0010AE876C|nr:histidine--tRNA ligase [Desulforhopalus sp. IMCC35007]TKB09939.1 histidine--tRNA ligase [Desulforhopalus sp. IMCC35007]
MKIKALKGFKDIIPGEVELWQYLESTARGVFERFDFNEIRLPILEETQLFARSIGEATDIVEKEMYTFVDKQVTMRPEATASLLRAYIEHGLYVQKPVQRLFTIGPMFRHERPQKGRLRQFHQLDVEVLGSESPRVDSELISMGAMLFDELGIKVSLEINSLGCPACRPGYREILVAYIAERFDALCSDCKRRSKTNPLRVLDCKVPTCREQIKDAPSILEHLCGDCSDHFGKVQDGLIQLGVDYKLNKFMVRGLDYYCKTTFEFITADLGSQAAVAAGGRYDGLIETLGGPKDSPGIGFAMGMERLVLLLQLQNREVTIAQTDLFIAGLGDEGVRVGYGLAHGLRKKGLSVAMDHEGRSLKALMKQANKAAARYTLIIGDSEIASGKGVLRDMHDREAEQQDVDLSAEAILSAMG